MAENDELSDFELEMVAVGVGAGGVTQKGQFGS